MTEEQIKELEALKDRPIIFEKVAEARILLKEYRGFSAIAEYEPESKVFFGRLDGIRDLVTFEAESESELVTQFQEAVDDYIDLCATLREASLSMFTEDYMQPEDGDTDKETTLFLSGKLDGYYGIRCSARAKKGYTQKQLSEATGIDQSDISKIERGVANPSISTLNKIAMALGMQLYVSIA